MTQSTTTYETNSKLLNFSFDNKFSNQINIPNKTILSDIDNVLIYYSKIPINNISLIDSNESDRNYYHLTTTKMFYQTNSIDQLFTKKLTTLMIENDEYGNGNRNGQILLIKTIKQFGHVLCDSSCPQIQGQRYCWGPGPNNCQLGMMVIMLQNLFIFCI